MWIVVKNKVKGCSFTIRQEERNFESCSYDTSNLFFGPRHRRLRSKIKYRGVSYTISRRLSLYVCINNDRWRSIDGAKRKVNYGKEGTLKNMAHLLACCILSRFSFRQIDITKLSRLSTANCCVFDKISSGDNLMNILAWFYQGKWKISVSLF